MGASVTLLAAAASVEPGGEATIEFRLRNTGSVVDEFALSVLGDAAAWSTVEPATISLFPGAEQNGTIAFRPPRSSAIPAGQLPFGLRAQSREDPAGSSVEEGTIEVGPFLEPFAELIPRTSRGSRSASHDLAVDNRGNVRLNAEVEAADADRLLDFDVKPPAVVVEPGEASFAKIQVKPTKRFWRGTPQTRPFQLFIRPEGATPITIDGTLLQEAILPPWFARAVAALIAGIIALILFWFLVLQPTIQSAATEAVASPLADLQAEVDNVNSALQDAGILAPTEVPEPSPTEPGETLPPDASPTPTATAGTVIPGLGAPLDGRLDSTTATFAPPGTLFITDLVFSNPNGREGAAVLLRDSTQLLPLRLENFRDLDFHFVTPIVITQGQTLNLSLACTGPNATPCDAAVFWNGYLRP